MLDIKNRSQTDFIPSTYCF